MSTQKKSIIVEFENCSFERINKIITTYERNRLKARERYHKNRDDIIYKPFRHISNIKITLLKDNGGEDNDSGSGNDEPVKQNKPIENSAKHSPPLIDLLS